MKGFINTKELAERWGLHFKTLYVWRAEKIGPPYIKLGKGEKATVYYNLKDVTLFENEEKKKGVIRSSVLELIQQMRESE